MLASTPLRLDKPPAARKAALHPKRRNDDILAMVAHELRNPLEPIRSAAYLLARRLADGPAIERNAVAIIERQVAQLSRLIEDLLDVARIKNGKMRLRSEPVRLGEVLGAAVDANLEFAKKAQLQIRLQTPRSAVWVQGDVVRLTQVFSNLLHNATKFSFVGGTVEISVRSDSAGHVAVSIRDQGSGIAADVIDSVFDLFTQEKRSSARVNGGLGIGLSVVRSLVEQHGGTVSVRSDGIGMGSEFAVTLPTTAAPPALALATVTAKGREGRRILLVDDGRDMAESMRLLLEMEGHTVALAFTGGSALDQAVDFKPEVVVLDIGLPDISGLDVARRLRARASPVPLLVALTGYDRDEDRMAALDAGFDHYLVKPVDLATLLAIVSARSAAISIPAVHPTLFAAVSSGNPSAHSSI